MKSKNCESDAAIAGSAANHFVVRQVNVIAYYF